MPLAKRTGVMLYCKAEEAVKNLSLEDAGKLLIAIFDYAFHGIEPRFEDSQSLPILWCFIRSDIESDEKRYIEKCKKNAYIAYKREREKKNLPYLEFEEWEIDYTDDHERERTCTDVNEREQMCTDVNERERMNTNTNINTNSNSCSNSYKQFAVIGGNNNSSSVAPTPSKQYGEYNNVILTDDELKQFKEEYPDLWEHEIERLSSYMKSSGKTYDDHFATLRRWAKDDAEKDKGKRSRNYQPSAYEADKNRNIVIDQKYRDYLQDCYENV